MKTVYFSEIIPACDPKVGRCRQLIELLKICHFLTFALGHLHMNIKTYFFSETTGTFSNKFCL